MRSRYVAGVLLAIALVLGPVSAALATSASFDVSLIAGGGIIDVFDEQGQDLCGRYLVYESRNTLNPSGKYQLVVYDRLSGASTVMTTSPGNQTNPDVWNGLVLYEDDASGTKDIRIHDLRTGVNSSIAGGAGIQAEPHIQDNVLVWRNGTTPWFRDRTLNVIASVPAGTGTQGNLGTSRGFVYYQDDDVLPNIYRYDHSWIETECISGNLTGNGNYAGDLAVHDDTVVWRGNRLAWPNPAIRTYDVRSGIEATLADSAYDRQQPDVFGMASTWVDDAGGTDGVRAKIEGWSWGSVYATPTVMGDPSVYGNSVAFGPGYDVWLAEHPTTVTRVAGGNRYATAAAMSERHFAESNSVVLASGENWPDALSAAGLAGAIDCPLLLVRKDSIPDETYQEIVRLGATSFMLVGGTAAVSEDVFETFQLDFGEFAIQRVAGSNRYQTAARVAGWVYDMTEMSPFNSTWSGMALVVSGENYADALAATPLSAARHMPILLTRQASLPSETASELSEDIYESAIIIGGEAAVSAGVKAAIDPIVQANPGGFESGRWWGLTRYGTAAVVAGNSVRARWLDLDALGLATGQGYADALGAGAALGSYGSPIVLTRPEGLPVETRDFFGEWPYDIGELQVVGGTGAVSEAAKDDAEGRLYP